MARTIGKLDYSLEQFWNNFKEKPHLTCVRRGFKVTPTGLASAAPSQFLYVGRMKSAFRNNLALLQLSLENGEDISCAL